MDQTTNSTAPSSPLARFLWIALILSTLYLCYFHNLGAVALVGPDEPRYAWIARDMAESGDWVTPRLYGKPWFEKPVLYYWAAAASFKLFGVSDAAARLPSAISALLATMALACLAWRAYGAETARWLLLLLPTTVGMIGFSHAVATDMPFAATLTIAMVFVTRTLKLVPPSDRKPGNASGSFNSFTSSTSFNSLLLGFFLGLAVLAKGPAAIILSGGAVLLWAVFTKRWRDAFRCLHPLAILSFCLTALPWYLLCAQRNPDFFRVFIIEHNFKRYLTPEFQHIQPFWYYIPILLIAFFPWTLALIWSAIFGSFRYLPARRPSPLTILLLSWSLFCLLFFSISKSKLPGYILPAIPAIGFLLTRSVTFLAPQGEKSWRWLLLSFSVVVGLAAFALLVMAHPLHPTKPLHLAFLSVACILLVFSIGNLLLSHKNNLAEQLKNFAPLCVVPLLLLLCLLRPVAAPWLRNDPSGKTLAAELHTNHISINHLFVQNMKRGQHYSLNFYLHQEIPDWNNQTPVDGQLLMNSKRCTEIVNPPWTCMGDPQLLPESGWFVYKVERSGLLGGPNRGLANGNGNNVGDGQPR